MANKFICISDDQMSCGIGKTIDEAWQNALDAGISECDFDTYTFHELLPEFEVKRTIVPVVQTIIVAKKTTSK